MPTLRIVSWNINGLASLRFPFNIHSHHTHVYPNAAARTPLAPQSNVPPPDDFDYDDTGPHSPHATASTSPSKASQTASTAASDPEPTVSPFSPDFPAFPSSRLVLDPQPISGYDALLDYFQGDIVCMQEVKISRARMDLLAKAAFVAGYDSFFSFSRKRQGYSGVATYTRTRTACPVAAEEGITGTLPPILSTLPSSTSASPLPSSLTSPVGHNTALLSAHSANELRDLDSEGRCIITDHGSFLLFNVYVPNSGESRDEFKLRFLALLHLRLRELSTAGRRLVVVGDINIAASPLDHCRPESTTLDDGSVVPFEDSPSRIWWRKNVTADPLHPDPSILVDTLRAVYPTQRNAYTCWNTLTGARAGNYGARIDYVLVSQALMGAVRDARVLGYVEGSDHCPVQCDLEVERLEAWKCGDVAPAHASQWWAEFSGQQKKLSQFFVKREESKADTAAAALLSAAAAELQPIARKRGTSAEAKRAAGDRKRAVDPTFKANARLQTKKRKVGDTGQAGPSLLSYFKSPPKPVVLPLVDVAASASPTVSRSSPLPAEMSTPAGERSPLTDADFFASSETSSPPCDAFPPSPSSPSSRSSSSTSLSPRALDAKTCEFNRLFTQSSLTLLCDHQLPAKLWTVNKKGANHGQLPSPPPTLLANDYLSARWLTFRFCIPLTCRCAGRQFFCCAVPPPERCKYWQWLSDAKKQIARGGGMARRRRASAQEINDRGGTEEESGTDHSSDSSSALTSAGFVSARQHPTIQPLARRTQPQQL